MRGGNRAWSIREGVSYGIGEGTGRELGCGRRNGQVWWYTSTNKNFICKGTRRSIGVWHKEGKIGEEMGVWHGEGKDNLCGIGDDISSANSQKGGNLT